jgi:hypothetical protein
VFHLPAWLGCRKRCLVVILFILRPACAKVDATFMLALYSCEIVALRKNVADRPESYDSFSAKSCVFLAHDLEHISSFPCTIFPKARYDIYYSRNITTLQSLTSLCHLTKHPRSRIWQMVGEKFKCGTFKAALDDVRYF